MSYLKPLVPITGVLILGFLLTGSLCGYAQIARDGARAVALGGAATALHGHLWSIHNPAVTAGVEDYRVELFGSRSFGLPELQTGALALAVPRNWGVLSATAHTFGFSQFRNTQIGLGAARRLSSPPLPPGAVGLLLIYDHTSIAGYSSTGAVGGVIGSWVELSSRLLLGLQAANIHHSVKRSSSTLRQRLALGIAYRPTDEVQLLIDLQKDIRYPLGVRAGIEFTPIEALALRTGISTAPRLVTAGIGLSAGTANGALAFVHHYALGWSPAVSIGTRW